MHPAARFAAHPHTGCRGQGLPVCFWLSVYQGRRCPGSDSALSVPVLSPAGPACRCVWRRLCRYYFVLYIIYYIILCQLIYFIWFFPTTSKMAAKMPQAHSLRHKSDAYSVLGQYRIILSADTASEVRQMLAKSAIIWCCGERRQWRMQRTEAGAAVAECEGLLPPSRAGTATRIIEHFGNADAVPQLPERCLSRKAGIVRCCLSLPDAARSNPPPRGKARSGCPW